MAQQLMNPTSIDEDVGLIPGLGLRMQHCHKLWYSLQTWLRSSVAVALAQAEGYSSDGNGAWEPPYAMAVALEETKRQRKEIK